MDILDGILVFLPLWCVTDGLRLDFWVYPVACGCFLFISMFFNPMLSGLVTAVLWIGGLVVCIMNMKTWFLAIYIVAILIHIVVVVLRVKRARYREI